MSPRFKAHSGTTGLSAVYDTMCTLQSSLFLKQISDKVVTERAAEGTRYSERASLVTSMIKACSAAKQAGQYTDNNIQVDQPASMVPSWGLGAGSSLTCSCSVNDDCGRCVTSCINQALPLQLSPVGYASNFSCSSTVGGLTLLEGSAAFDPALAPAPGWSCTPGSEKCSAAWTAMAPPTLPYLGTSRLYGAPPSVQALMMVFGVLCTASQVILGLFALTLLAEMNTIFLVWLNVRSSTHLSVHAAWQKEKLVAWSTLFIFIVASVPASLYGAYLVTFARLQDWGASVNLEAVSFPPFPSIPPQLQDGVPLSTSRRSVAPLFIPPSLHLSPLSRVTLILSHLRTVSLTCT